MAQVPATTGMARRDFPHYPALKFCQTAFVAMLICLAACGGSPAVPQPSATQRGPGPLGDTWTGDGTTWHEANVSGPAPRYFAALAYDAPRHDYVLFGGQTAKGTSDETWTWDGRKWTAMAPGHKPPPRRGAAMAYDPSHQLVVMYGGLIPDQSEGSEAADTWTWNGTDWQHVGPDKGAPGYRDGPRMVTAGNRVLLFGGHIGNVAYFGDVWTWDGELWSRVDVKPTPPGRGNAAVTWNPTDLSLFVYGGTGINATGGPGAQGTQLDDGWSLKGTRWTQLIGSGPGPLAFASAVWDSKASRVLVLLGISCPNPVHAVWTWDGRTWSKSADAAISARWGAALAQDDAGNVLLFGGSDEAGC